MKRSLRSIVLAPSAAFALALTGCESDVQPVGDALAQDSTLALAVLGARPDSAVDFADMASADVDPMPIAASPAEPEVSVARSPATPAPQTTSRRAAVAPAPRATSRPRAAASVRSSSPSSARVASSPRPVATTSRVSAATTVQPAAPSRAWLILPAGAVLEFEAGHQICAITAGDAFDATLADDVIRADGVVIPDGAKARGSIVANTSGSGTAPPITIKWLTFNGRMYALKTRVTEADTRNVRTRTGATHASCIPDGGRIVAELTEPLRIALSD